MIRFEPPPQRGLLAWLRRHFHRRDQAREFDLTFRRARLEISRVLVKMISDPAIAEELTELLD